jgi:hypothetical protein
MAAMQGVHHKRKVSAILTSSIAGWLGPTAWEAWEARCIEGRQGLKLIGDLKQDVLASGSDVLLAKARLVRTQTKTPVRVRHCVRTSILSPFSRTTCPQGIYSS